MWKVQGAMLSATELPVLAPDKVLLFYDGPRSFTVNGVSPASLAHWCEDDAEVSRFIIVTVSPDQLIDLEQGRVTFLQVLSSQRTCRVIDVTHEDWRAVRGWEVNFKDIPRGLLPSADVRLLPKSA